MTIHRNDFHSQTPGVTVTPANSANSGDAFSSVGTGTGTITYSTDPASGSFTAIKLTPGSASGCYVRDTSFNSTSMAVSDCFYYAAVPTGDMRVYMLATAAGQAASVVVTSAGKIKITNSAGSNAGTGSTALTTGHWYRVETQVFSDASAGTINCQWYIDDGSTQTGSLSASAANTRGGSITQLDRGPSDPSGANVTTNWYYTRLQAQDGSTTPLGSFATQLTTPVVTLGTTTNPSTSGGSNGSQVVSWSSVAGASSYEAWIASSSTPAQGDFTRVATGVTSPYTFTGLSAGTYSFGIKAKV